MASRKDPEELLKDNRILRRRIRQISPGGNTGGIVHKKRNYYNTDDLKDSFSKYYDKIEKGLKKIW